jgi:hypothetical protein
MLQLRHARDALEEITISDINRYLRDNAEIAICASKQPPLLHQLDRFISGALASCLDSTHSSARVVLRRR